MFQNEVTLGSDNMKMGQPIKKKLKPHLNNLHVQFSSGKRSRESDPDVPRAAEITQREASQVASINALYMHMYYTPTPVAQSC